MQQSIPVKFMQFDFVDCYYKLREPMTVDMVEQWFNASVSEQCRPIIQLIDPGPVLTIEQWSEREASLKSQGTDPEEYILLHILQIMPLTLDSFNEARQVVHELVVQAWSCFDDSSPSAPNETRYQAFNLKIRSFFLVFDRWMTSSLIHAFKKGHMCLVFTRPTYDRLVLDSGTLMRLIDLELSYGMEINLGRTLQEMSENLHRHNRARELVDKVFSYIDIARLRLRDEILNAGFRGAGLVPTGTLDGAKRPPAPPLVSQDE